MYLEASLYVSNEVEEPTIKYTCQTTELISSQYIIVFYILLKYIQLLIWLLDVKLFSACLWS